MALEECGCFLRRQHVCSVAILARSDSVGLVVALRAAATVESKTGSADAASRAPCTIGAHVRTLRSATRHALGTRAHPPVRNAARTSRTCGQPGPQPAPGSPRFPRSAPQRGTPCAQMRSHPVLLTERARRAYIFATKSKVARSPALAAVGCTDVLDSTQFRTGAGV